METVRSKRDVQTLLSDADRAALGRMIALFGQFVELDPIGRYSTMTPEDVWQMLVVQVCVMGSARLIERLYRDTAKRKEFEEVVSLRLISQQQNPVAYLAETLRNFSATRFPQKGAERLVTILQSSSVFRDGNLILFQELSHKDDAIQTRDELIKRCRIFRLKSASDFMISVGLSHDVIALDTRIINILRDHFDYNLTPTQIQSSRRSYLSLEAALREFCREQNVSLALLDRLLFRFSNLGAIELAMRYPELTRCFE